MYLFTPYFLAPAAQAADTATMLASYTLRGNEPLDSQTPTSLFWLYFVAAAKFIT